VVDVPGRCLDAEGFTLNEFGRPADPHHGNEAYGAIMMGEILAHLGPGRSNPVSALHSGQEIP
jgi:hypothetical protein